MLPLRFCLTGIALPLGLTLLPALRSCAQGTPALEKTAPAFDVVSIREAQPEPGTTFSWRNTGNGLDAMTTVENFVQNAYNFVLEDQIVNLPGWAKSERFEITAKMDPDTYATFEKLSDNEKDQQWTRMLQSILTSRFHMQAHSDMRPMPVYALVIAKGGSRLKPAVPGPHGWSTGRGRITSQSLDIATLSTLLSGSAGRIVVDRTALTGQYAVSLAWTPDDQRGMPDSGPSLFTALEEQLGLRLESSRAPVPVLVVDNIERPSAN